METKTNLKVVKLSPTLKGRRGSGNKGKFESGPNTSRVCSYTTLKVVRTRVEYVLTQL